MEQDLFALLNGSDLFSGTGAAALHTLAAQATSHEGRRGTIIADQRAPFPYLGIVIDGLISVTVEAEGSARGVRRLHVYEAGAGETFGEIAVLSTVPPLGDIKVASRHAAYALIPAAAVIELINAQPQLFSRLIDSIARRSKALAERLVAQQNRSVASRVAEVLLRFTSENESAGLHPAQPQLRQLTQQEIAAMAGCVKEAAARAIAQLENDGALRREHGHIAYLDRARLADMAK